MDNTSFTLTQQQQQQQNHYSSPMFSSQPLSSSSSLPSSAAASFPSSSSSSSSSSSISKDALSLAKNVGATVFVGRLPRRSDAQDIFSFFSSVGPVRQIIPSRDTYLFIEYEHPDLATLASQMLNGQGFGGSRIVVQPATTLTKLFIGGIDKSLDAKSIHDAIYAVEPGLMSVELFEMSGAEAILAAAAAAGPATTSTSSPSASGGTPPPSLSSPQQSLASSSPIWSHHGTTADDDAFFDTDNKINNSRQGGGGGGFGASLLDNTYNIANILGLGSSSDARGGAGGGRSVMYRGGLNGENGVFSSSSSSSAFSSPTASTHTSAKLSHRGFCFAEFSDHASAHRALRGLIAPGFSFAANPTTPTTAASTSALSSSSSLPAHSLNDNPSLRRDDVYRVSSRNNSGERDHESALNLLQQQAHTSRVDSATSSSSTSDSWLGLDGSGGSGGALTSPLSSSSPASVSATGNNNNNNSAGLRVDWAEPLHEVSQAVMETVKILYVSNLPPSHDDASEETIMSLFNSPTESGNGVERVKRLKNYAFVHFRTRHEAEQSLLALQDHVIAGHAIKVQWSKPPPKPVRHNNNNNNNNGNSNNGGHSSHGNVIMNGTSMPPHKASSTIMNHSNNYNIISNNQQSTNTGGAPQHHQNSYQLQQQHNQHHQRHQHLQQQQQQQQQQQHEASSYSVTPHSSSTHQHRYDPYTDQLQHHQHGVDEGYSTTGPHGHHPHPLDYTSAHREYDEGGVYPNHFLPSPSSYYPQSNHQHSHVPSVEPSPDAGAWGPNTSTRAAVPTELSLQRALHSGAEAAAGFDGSAKNSFPPGSGNNLIHPSHQPQPDHLQYHNNSSAYGAQSSGGSRKNSNGGAPPPHPVPIAPRLPFPPTAVSTQHSPKLQQKLLPTVAHGDSKHPSSTAAAAASSSSFSTSQAERAAYEKGLADGIAALQLVHAREAAAATRLVAASSVESLAVQDVLLPHPLSSSASASAPSAVVLINNQDTPKINPASSLDDATSDETSPQNSSTTSDGSKSAEDNTSNSSASSYVETSVIGILVDASKKSDAAAVKKKNKKKKSKSEKEKSNGSSNKVDFDHQHKQLHSGSENFAGQDVREGSSSIFMGPSASEGDGLSSFGVYDGDLYTIHPSSSGSSGSNGKILGANDSTFSTPTMLDAGAAQPSSSELFRGARVLSTGSGSTSSSGLGSGSVGNNNNNNNYSNNNPRNINLFNSNVIVDGSSSKTSTFPPPNHNFPEVPSHNLGHHQHHLRLSQSSTSSLSPPHSAYFADNRGRAMSSASNISTGTTGLDQHYRTGMSDNSSSNINMNHVFGNNNNSGVSSRTISGDFDGRISNRSVRTGSTSTAVSTSTMMSVSPVANDPTRDPYFSHHYNTGSRSMHASSSSSLSQKGFSTVNNNGNSSNNAVMNGINSSGQQLHHHHLHPPHTQSAAVSSSMMLVTSTRVTRVSDPPVPSASLDGGGGGGGGGSGGGGQTHYHNHNMQLHQQQRSSLTNASSTPQRQLVVPAHPPIRSHPSNDHQQGLSLPDNHMVASNQNSGNHQHSSTPHVVHPQPPPTDRGGYYDHQFSSRSVQSFNNTNTTDNNSYSHPYQSHTNNIAPIPLPPPPSGSSAFNSGGGPPFYPGSETMSSSLSFGGGKSGGSGMGGNSTTPIMGYPRQQQQHRVSLEDQMLYAQMQQQQLLQQQQLQQLGINSNRASKHHRGGGGSKRNNHTSSSSSGNDNHNSEVPSMMMGVHTINNSYNSNHNTMLMMSNNTVSSGSSIDHQAPLPPASSSLPPPPTQYFGRSQQQQQQFLYPTHSSEGAFTANINLHGAGGQGGSSFIGNSSSPGGANNSNNNNTGDSALITDVNKHWPLGPL